MVFHVQSSHHKHNVGKCIETKTQVKCQTHAVKMTNAFTKSQQVQTEKCGRESDQPIRVLASSHPLTVIGWRAPEPWVGTAGAELDEHGSPWQTVKVPNSFETTVNHSLLFFLVTVAKHQWGQFQKASMSTGWLLITCFYCCTNSMRETALTTQIKQSRNINMFTKRYKNYF